MEVSIRKGQIYLKLLNINKIKYSPWQPTNNTIMVYNTSLIPVILILIDNQKNPSHLEEQKYEESESPEKLYGYLDKENLPDESDNIVQNLQLQASKKVGYLSDKRDQISKNIEDVTVQKFKSEKQEFEANVRDRLSNIPPLKQSIDLRNGQISQGISMTQSNYAPQGTVGGVQRISTINRMSQSFQLHRNVKEIYPMCYNVIKGYYYFCDKPREKRELYFL